MAAFRPDGLRLLQNNSIAGDQSVPHLHLHIIPCRQDGAAQPALPHGRGPRLPFEERKRIAEQIRAHLKT